MSSAPVVRRSTFALVIALALSATGAAPGRAEPPPLAPVTEPQYSPMPTERIWVETRHGTLAVDLTRPSTAGIPVPVILSATPYAVIGLPEIGAIWVRRGYATAVSHVLGTGDSGGCWDYGGVRERESLYDLVQWLGDQTWSNGNVGMIGASYDGTTANAAAVQQAIEHELHPERPQRLATIVPEVAISDWYGYAYHDGIRYFVMDPAQRQGLVIDEQGFDTPLAFDFVHSIVPTRNRAPGFEQRLIERACPGMADRIEHTQRGYELDPDFDSFWRERSYLADASKVRVPVLVQGGWRDYNVKHSESSRWYEALPLDDPATGDVEGVPFKMLFMGQGAHGAIGAEFSFATVLHAWFDRFLYGYETNITAQLPSVSMANDGVLRRDGSWPPPGTAGVALHLRPGLLTPDGPASGSSSFVDTGGMSESEALRSRGGSDVLWFETEPLSAPLRVSGMPHLNLFASTTGTSTQFTPVLFDLGPPANPADSLCTFVPAAEACVISRGFLNARHRNGIDQGIDLVSGEEYTATVRFLDNDWVVAPGHRIGLALMSSNLWWALPDQQRAMNTILHDAQHPSALVVPVVGGTDALATALP